MVVVVVVVVVVIAVFIESLDGKSVAGRLSSSGQPCSDLVALCHCLEARLVGNANAEE